MKKEEKNFLVDLHVHTTFSDGVFTPEKVVEKALERRLRAVSITDHDCMDGVGPAVEAAGGTELEIVPGVEISAAKDDTEIHILGYFVDWHDKPLLAMLSRMRSSRVERMKKMVACLRERGLEITEEKVFAGDSGGTIGRLHLARVLVEEKLVSGEQEAFDRYIGDGKPCHVKHERLDYRRAIDMIKGAGGVAVLAHPGTMGSDEYISDYIEAGLKGIEAYHSKHWPETSSRYLKIAEDNDLIVTGGSDCHGKKRGEILIGKVKVGYDVVEALRAEAEKNRADSD